MSAARCPAILRQMRDGSVFMHNRILLTGHEGAHECGRHPKGLRAPNPCEWFTEPTENDHE